MNTASGARDDVYPGGGTYGGALDGILKADQSMLEDGRSSIEVKKEKLLKDYDKGAFGSKGQTFCHRTRHDRVWGSGYQCRISFILRPMKDDGSGGYHEHTGHAYVHGIMNGEALKRI